MQSSSVVDAARSQTKRALSVSLAIVVPLLIGGFAGFAGCGLSTEGIPSGGCTDDLACPPPDLCKVGSCGTDGKCAFVGLPDMVPPVQIPGDCVQVTCSDGKPVTTPDPKDSDDGNPCTTDSCSGGKPSHEKQDDGVPCGAMSTCKGGVCVTTCGSPTDKCPDLPKDNPCTEDSCDVAASTCTHTPVSGKLIDETSPNDCIKIICVDGKPTSVSHDSESGDDMKPCTVDSCMNGAPVNTPVDKGLPCGEFQCDGKGNCGCNTIEDCVGDETECHKRTCVDNVCGILNTAPNTALLAGQTSNDCKIWICDGNGQAIQVDDNGDTPVPDANACTYDQCLSGQPDHSNIPSGQPAIPATMCPVTDPTMCGSDGTCNGSGACRSYAGTNCGTPLGCAGTTLTNQDFCDGNGVCHDNGTSSCSPYTCDPTSCKMSCTVDGDCDGSHDCNTTTMACVAMPGAPCSTNPECGTNHCVKSNCCMAASCSQCSNCTTGNCGFAPAYSQDGCSSGKKCDGAGTCKLDDGQMCNTASDCIANCCMGSPNKLCKGPGC